MKEAKITIETAEHRHESGRAYLEYKPVFSPDVCGQGSLSFAVFQVWKDEPETHMDGQRKAIANAVNVMQRFASEITKKYCCTAVISSVTPSGDVLNAEDEIRELRERGIY